MLLYVLLKNNARLRFLEKKNASEGPKGTRSAVSRP